MVTVDSCQMKLGNQLFKIAAGYALAVRNNDEFLMPPWNHCDYFGEMKPYDGRHIVSYYYQQEWGPYRSIPYCRDMCLEVPGRGNGFLQSEKYFSDCKMEISSLLFPKCKKKFIYEGMNTCCVHIRRGDYVALSPRKFPLIPPSYYEYCMLKLRSKFNDISFIVFSDDIQWCKEVFSDCYFAEGNSDIDDFSWMCRCNHHIIANSTFSWWAAWLNKNQNKIVYAPSIWFGPEMACNTVDLIPDTWIREPIYP